MILYNDCLQLYSDEMQKSIIEIEPFIDDNKLREFHTKAKSDAMAQVRHYFLYHKHFFKVPSIFGIFD